MNTGPSSGPGLEARVLRLFLAQGSFAERRLWPSATPDHRMLATDIDVLVSEYVSGFHLTRRHIECKGGQMGLLDRVLWLNGVRTLLGADSSYLVGTDLDLEASTFAGSLDIQLVSLKQLESWESSLGILQDAWPCRSYLGYDTARHHWTRKSKEKGADEYWFFLRSALSFIEVDSWLRFEYRHLNKLLRLMETIGSKYEGCRSDKDQELCSRYVFSALLVRLSQYLLAICLNLESILPADTKEYLVNRLTFGDQDPAHISGLIKGTLDWVKKTLTERGVSWPPEIDVGRLYVAPPYAEEMIQLIEKLLTDSNNARYLVISMEVSQFGRPDTVTQFPLLKGISATGDNLAAFVKGFVVRALSVPKKLADSVAIDIIEAYPSWGKASDKATSTGGQLTLE